MEEALNRDIDTLLPIFSNQITAHAGYIVSAAVFFLSSVSLLASPISLWFRLLSALLFLASIFFGGWMVCRLFYWNAIYHLALALRGFAPMKEREKVRKVLMEEGIGLYSLICNEVAYATSSGQGKISNFEPLRLPIKIGVKISGLFGQKPAFMRYNISLSIKD